MEKKQFLRTLRDALIDRGFSPELAERHVRSLSLTLTPDDIKSIENIQDPAEIALLAEGIANLKERTAAQKAADTVTSAASSEPISEEEFDDSDDDVKVYTGASDAAPAEQTAEDDVFDDVYEEAIEETEAAPAIVPTRRGRTVFWTLLICTLPITLALLAVYFAVFGIGFAALISVIISLFVLLIGGVAVGATVSLVGIIYGIVQLITAVSLAPGLYEIGLGLSVAGAVMLAGILVYNCAIHLIPWIIRLLGKLFRICTDKLKVLFKFAKEACYKL